MVFEGNGASSCSMERQKNFLSQLDVLLVGFDGMLVLAKSIILISDRWYDKGTILFP